MRSQMMVTIVLTLISCGQALGGENGSRAPPRRHFLQRLHPAGGWNPYGGGLLHWWDPHCFPVPGCPGRLLPQAASQGVLAALPALLHLGAAGDRLSREQWSPGLQHAALKTPTAAFFSSSPIKRLLRAHNDCVAHTPGSMRIHPPVSPLRKGGALRRSGPFPFPPYEGGIRGVLRERASRVCNTTVKRVQPSD